MGFDVEAARRALKERAERRRAALEERYERASRQLEAFLEIVRAADPVRVIVWGSMLRPERFTEISDIDVCVEGIGDWDVWSRLERAALEAGDIPVDLVRWESIIPLEREGIMARGKVVYERE